jgi:nucleoside-diphosphate kinase
MEKTLILLKPDTVQRGLVGEVMQRLERKGLKLAGMKMMKLSSELLTEHYAHLADKPFFPSLVEYMQSTPVVAICVEGVDAVNQIRRIVGATNANEAEIGSIRGDFGNSVACNLIHASDSLENAEIEVKRFFEETEVFNYNRELDSLIFG